jgi:protein tyrosine/serine phosphatase
MNRRWFIVGTLAISTSAFARDAKWAKPQTIDGLPNLNFVAPNLYRSAQPTAQGFLAAQKTLGVKTVLSLRNFHSDALLLVDTHIEAKSEAMNPLYITNNDIISSMKIITAGQAKGPVLVHCLHGADRTGVVIAMYRILYQNWSKEQAIDEMKNGGFNFHREYTNIPAFIKNADIAQFKLALAITP